MAFSHPVSVNGRTYAPPRRPLVVICMDGSAPAYTTQAMAAGVMPYLARTLPRGFAATAHCVIPSFTNPNNLSIMTGATPAVHGISGNYFIDPHHGEAVMMNDPSYLRAETIMAAFSRQGLPVAIVTAKDKLRRLLGRGLVEGVCFSAEKAHETSHAEHGITDVLSVMDEPLPEVYSAELTGFTLRAGVTLLAGKFRGVRRPELLYLSTTDYIQHKHAPGTEEANALYQELDRTLEAIDRLGATWVLTADHGMNAKTYDDGSPRVLFLQTLVDEWLGPQAGRVILPITDPYVVHHGALGSFAMVYLRNQHQASKLISLLQGRAHLSWVGTSEQASREFSLPVDRIGDVVVISDAQTVVGTSRELHDLSCLSVPLRSHGGLGEQEVPLFSNVPAAALPSQGQWHNYDAFHVGLNCVTTQHISRGNGNRP